MAISDYKIRPADVSAVNVESANDVLSGTAQQNKQVFDKYSDMIVDKFNAFIDFFATQDTNEIDKDVIDDFKSHGWVEPTN